MSRIVAVPKQFERVQLADRHAQNNVAVNLDIVTAINRFTFPRNETTFSLTPASGFVEKDYVVVGINFRILGGENITWEFRAEDEAIRDKIYDYLVDIDLSEIIKV